MVKNVLAVYQKRKLLALLMSYISINCMPERTYGVFHDEVLDVLIYNAACYRYDFIIQALERPDGVYEALKYPDFERLGYILQHKPIPITTLIANHNKFIPVYNDSLAQIHAYKTYISMN